MLELWERKENKCVNKREMRFLSPNTKTRKWNEIIKSKLHLLKYCYGDEFRANCLTPFTEYFD